MSVQQLNTDNFDAAISVDKAVLVDFFADWCGPCKMQTPVLHKVADEYSDKMGFGAVNVDESEDIAAKYGIQSIPTLVVFKQPHSGKGLRLSESGQSGQAHSGRRCPCGDADVPRLA